MPVLVGVAKGTWALLVRVSLRWYVFLVGKGPTGNWG